MKMSSNSSPVNETGVMIHENKALAENRQPAAPDAGPVLSRRVVIENNGSDGAESCEAGWEVKIRVPSAAADRNSAANKERPRHRF